MTESCQRCGYILNLEKHRIVHGIEGGKYTSENIRILCKSCHDYQHAKDTVQAAIEREKERLRILQRRLELIESLNTPERLAQGETYQSYFDSFSEPIPAIINKCGRQT